MIAPGKDVDADYAMLARALGALIAVRRFDPSAQVAEAVHESTLALRMFAEELSDSELAHVKHLNQQAIDGGGFGEPDRQWLMERIRRTLGKAGLTESVEERIH